MCVCVSVCLCACLSVSIYGGHRSCERAFSVDVEQVIWVRIRVCVCLCPLMVATAHVSAHSAVDVEQVIRVRIRVCVCLSVSIYGGHRLCERAVCCGCEASHTGEEMCVCVFVCVCRCNIFSRYCSWPLGMSKVRVKLQFTIRYVLRANVPPFP